MTPEPTAQETELYGTLELLPDDAAFIAHARTSLPLALQGLEDALRVVEAARVEDLNRYEPASESSRQLRAALAHFDAREAENAHGV